MENKSFFDKVLNWFSLFEKIITVFLSIIIALIILIALIRISESFYHLFVQDFYQPQEITFNDYQLLFGKIMTLLISIEFMSSILKVLKTHEIKNLIQDVVLITALAIARKLIIYDYEHHDPLSTIVLGGLLISIGLFYFLIKKKD
ncbi:MAG: phosphate-starvation-inducible PsiE family protein [Vicingus serpentipes]|nr:phosphate-starvation-inducible PsiE family protein [Vicingus serpentipes]